MEPARVQNSESAEGAALLRVALELVALDPDAELSSSDPPHAETRTTTAATDSAPRQALGIRRMSRG
jgi:hypothetical protein